MKNSRITLKPVKELLGKKFFIPDYQRGYRWKEQQALDLLNDIWAFACDNKGHSEIYCIQPLVVQRKQDDILEKIKTAQSIEMVEAYLEKRSWNVVDGQQRLTTIYIILSALGIKTPYEIDYQTRDQSKQFLMSIDQSKKDDNIDFFHIYLVHQATTKWLGKLEEKEKEIFKNHLLEKVHFIWYQIADENSMESRNEAIAAFTRLNIGKIPLTDSELIKALFLNRTNFECSTVDVDKKQRAIAMEWDRIEYTLQDDAFWLFIHGTEYDRPTRIDFIFDMICEQEALGPWKENESEKANKNKKKDWDEHRTFRYFYYTFNHAEVNTEWLQEKWNMICEYFQIFNEWYRDYKMYHYIGYLTCVLEDKGLIKNLVKEWKGCSKADFTKRVKDRILRVLLACKGFSDLDKFVYEEEYQGKVTSKRDCVPILLLHNIETIVQQNEKLVKDQRYSMPDFSRFPFHLYKREKWEVEHIRPNAGDKLKDKDMQQVFACLAKKYLGHIEDLGKEINKYLKGKGEFETVYDKILEVDKSLNEDEKNMIWNYTLLDGKTNKEYGNAIFPIKRAFIANKERGYKIKYKVVNGKLDTKERSDEIAFVPPCTRNVFAKFYTDVPEGMLEWTKLDAEAYLEDIKEKLAVYIKDSKGDTNE